MELSKGSLLFKKVNKFGNIKFNSYLCLTFIERKIFYNIEVELFAISICNSTNRMDLKRARINPTSVLLRLYLSWSEKLTHNQKVAGSSPAGRTKKFKINLVISKLFYTFVSRSLKEILNHKVPRLADIP